MIVSFQRTELEECPADVLGSGAVLLGGDVTCDGFHKNRRIRIQTHAHEDHLNDFATSKSGIIVLTKATQRLLENKHRDLPYRPNVHALEYGKTIELYDNIIELYSSNHILGAAQAKVTTPDGVIIGYSGDFGWPIEDIMQVDILVVDATYGTPSQKSRTYTQVEAQQEFVNRARSLLRQGPLHICASLGPLQRALYALETEEISDGVTIIASKHVKYVVDVHTEFGLPMPSIACTGTPEAQEAIRSGSYIKLHGTYEVMNDGLVDGGVIQLTRYRVDGQEPIIQTADNRFRIGFSNHADFDQTIEYIHSTGAHLVVTDWVRASKGRNNESNKAVQLAKAVRRELRIQAFPASGHTDLLWGS